MLNRLLFVLSILCISSHAFAAEGTSEATDHSIMDDMYINYFGIYHGPQVGNPGSPYTLTNKGLQPKSAYSDGTNSQNFDSELTAAYMVTKDFGIGGYAQFNLYTVRGYGATMGDAGIKMFDKHFVRTPQLNVYANLILEAPIGYDAVRGVDFKVKMTPNFRYDFSGTRYSVGAWTEETFYLGASDKMSNNKAMKIDLLPYALYQLAPKWALNVTYEYETDHMAGKSNMDFTAYQSDIMPGFVYTIAPKIIVNPYLQFFTTEKIALDRTALGATLTAGI